MRLLSQRCMVVSNTYWFQTYVCTVPTVPNMYNYYIKDTVEDMDSICTYAGYIYKFIPKLATNVLI